MATQKPPYLSPEPSWSDKFSPMTKDLLSVLVLLGIIYALFQDIIFQNMIFSTGGDNAAAYSWAKAIEHIKVVEGMSPLWIPYIFSGIPIASSLLFPDNVNYLETILHIPSRLLFMGSELHWFVLHYFLMGVAMYLIARQFNLPALASLIAALTLMLNPYAIGLAQGGHGSKLITLSYIPFLFLFVHTLFQRRDLLSLGFLSATLGTLLLSRHPQIAFYGLLLVGMYLIMELFFNPQPLRQVIVKFVLFSIAVGLGFLIYVYEFLPTQEYAQFSIRGAGEAGTAGGLHYDYATNWSFHPGEILNYVIPSFFGFESPYYWGWMPFTDTTVYIGIIPLVFGILALIYARNHQTIFLAIFSMLILFISFGKHLPVVYDLLFDYVPYFNKFRAPSMILHLMPITLGLLAAHGFAAFTDLGNRLQELYLDPLRKRFMIAAGIIGATLAVGYLGNNALYEFTSGFMFEKEGDLQQLQLKRMRFDLLGKDFVKFAVVSSAIIGLILLYLKRFIKSTVFGFGMLIVLAIDLLIISAKFINPKPRSDFERVFAPDATVQFLKSDTSLYRIFPIYGLFQDNAWMYHTVQSVGGYSPAKLKIYQELIDSCFYRSPDPNFPYFNPNITDMLNVKYILAQGQLPGGRYSVVKADQNKNIVTHLNPSFMPRAWFVEEAIVAGNKREIFQRLNSPGFNPRTTAILEKPPSIQPMKSDSAMVHITSFGAHKIVINTYCSNTSLLVLSEVFYPAGWNAYLDGTAAEIYKTNYILRSVIVPSGTHTVEFLFDPPVYGEGLTVTNVAWGITIVVILLGIFQHPAIRAKLGKRGRGAAPPPPPRY